MLTPNLRPYDGNLAYSFLNGTIKATVHDA
jgi:hypothetical protein